MTDPNALPEIGGVGEVNSRPVPGRDPMPEKPSPIPSTPVPPASEPEELTLDDLKLSLVLLDACAQRGAFKIDEFSVVGKLHDRMNSYIARQENKKP